MVSEPLMAPPVVPVAAPLLLERFGHPADAAALLGWPKIHDADRSAGRCGLQASMWTIRVQCAASRLTYGAGARGYCPRRRSNPISTPGGLVAVGAQTRSPPTILSCRTPTALRSRPLGHDRQEGTRAGGCRYATG